MQKMKYKLNIDEEINKIIMDIKTIDEHIVNNKRRFFCFKKKNVVCDKRNSELEDVRRYLLKRLEHIVGNNKNYH